MKLVLTCEHGGNAIPSLYKSYFSSKEHILNSHRGFDLGALSVFNDLKPLADAAFSSNISRLLIELNRSLHHPNLFSEFSKNLPKSQKGLLINSYYLVYRNKVENTIKDWVLKHETVLHLSIHSFTPVLNNETRTCDIGLLYDAKRTDEKAFCIAFKKSLLAVHPTLKVRFNYPYLGTADGFTSYLRKQFKRYYLGIEVEVNQKYVINNKTDVSLIKALSTGLESLLKAIED